MSTTVHHDAPMGFEDMPLLEDGTLDFRRLAVKLVEDCVNAAMELAADELLGEGNRRNGYRERELKTVIGVITLKIPKLREGSYFPDEVMLPYSRCDRAMAGIISEAYRLGLSTRKIEKAAAELEFGRLSPSTVSRMCASLDEEVAELRGREFDQDFPYLWLDATYVSCRSDGCVEGRALVTAIAAGVDGKRRFVGLEFVDTESYQSWRGFLLGLRARGVAGVELVVSDAHAGLRRAIREVFAGSSWQRCITHLMRDVSGKIGSKGDRKRAMAAVSAAFRESDPVLVREMYGLAAEHVRSINRKAGELLEDAREDALAYLSFPSEHRLRIRTNNVQERANREIKRRTKVVQVFPSPSSLIRLVGAILVDIGEDWMQARFMDADDMRSLRRDNGAHNPSEQTRRKAEMLIAEAVRAVS